MESVNYTDKKILIIDDEEDITDLLEEIIRNESEEYAYIIGFPAKISKVTMYFNYKNYINVKYIILILSLVIIIGILLYGIIVNKTLLKIVSSIKSISLNSEEASKKFVPLKEKGIYKDVFHNINFLNDRLKASEEERKLKI